MEDNFLLNHVVERQNYPLGFAIELLLPLKKSLFSLGLSDIVPTLNIFRLEDRFDAIWPSDTDLV